MRKRKEVPAAPTSIVFLVSLSAFLRILVSSELDRWDDRERGLFRYGGVTDDDDVVEDTFEVVELLFLALFLLLLLVERDDRRGCNICRAPLLGTGIVSCLLLYERSVVWCCCM